MTDDPTVVETTNGPVRGLDDGITKSWRGIRYAAPPVGELRWRAPIPPQPWTDVADATVFGAVAPQPGNPVIRLGPDVVQDEDCLSLNIWSASTVEHADRRPVMVWLHGGAYVFGSSSQPLYDGRALVADGDVVLVAVNYRLGALGFLDLSSCSTDQRTFDSNLALRDIILGLEWVRDNIAAFGGDPDRVTLFGESAGGSLVTTLLTIPSAGGLFARAIAQSSPATSVYDSARAARVAGMFLEKVGIAATDVAALADLGVDKIVAAGQALFSEVPARSPGTLAFAPTVDRDLLPDYPLEAYRAGKSHPVPLIIGTNKDEASLFKWMKSPLMPITPAAIRSMFAEIASEQPELNLPSEAEIGSAYTGMKLKAAGLAVARDIGFRMPTLWLADGHSAVAPVYLYRFDWATPMLRALRVGATHAAELPYVWGNLVVGSKDITFKLGGMKVGKALSARMQNRWISFAVDGHPQGLPGDPEWLPYESGRRSTLVFDRQDSAVDDLDRELREAWGNDVLNFR